MATKTLAKVSVEIDSEGYFIHSGQWTEEMAKEMATEEGITLTPIHLEVLLYIRSRAAAGESLTMRSIKNSGIVDIKAFYGLFPGAPLKLASKLAGISKPTSCV